MKLENYSDKLFEQLDTGYQTANFVICNTDNDYLITVKNNIGMLRLAFTATQWQSSDIPKPGSRQFRQSLDFS